MTIIIKSDKAASNSLGRLEDFGIWGQSTGTTDVCSYFTGIPYFAAALNRLVPTYTGYTAQLTAYDGATAQGSAKIKGEIVTPDTVLYERDATATSRGVSTLGELAGGYTLRVTILYNQGSATQKECTPNSAEYGEIGPMVFDGTNWTLIGSVMGMSYSAGESLWMGYTPISSSSILAFFEKSVIDPTDVNVLYSGRWDNAASRHQGYVEPSSGIISILTQSSSSIITSTGTDITQINYQLAVHNGASSKLVLGNYREDLSGTLLTNTSAGITMGSLAGDAYFNGKIGGLIVYNSDKYSEYTSTVTDILDGALVN
jgi:hypothetical protein